MKLRALAVMLVVVLTASACGDDGDDGGGATASGIDTISAGKLTACSDLPYAPFEFGEAGKEEGIGVDLLKAIAEKMELEAVFRDTDFDGIFAALKAGQCDVIESSVTITDERKKENDFSDGYFKIQQSLLVRKGDETTFNDLAALKGKTIGVQSETTGADYAKENAKDVSIKEFTGVDEMFSALKAKQIDGIVQDYPVNAYNARTTGETAVSKRFDSADVEEYGFVIPKGKTELKEAIDKGLQELKDDGTYDTIVKKYLGDEAAA